jgi:hypothetical protein
MKMLLGIIGCFIIVGGMFCFCMVTGALVNQVFVDNGFAYGPFDGAPQEQIFPMLFDFQNFVGSLPDNFQVSLVIIIFVVITICLAVVLK